jgi:hypothetical protein
MLNKTNNENDCCAEISKFIGEQKFGEYFCSLQSFRLWMN